MDAKTLIAGLAARAAELGASTETNKIMKFNRCREALARIHEMEKKLGLPPGGTIYRILDANRRVAELETMLALTEKSSSGAASPVFTKNFPDAPPIARTAAPASLPPKATPDRENLLEIIEQVFPLEAIGRCEGMTTGKLLNHVQKLVWQAGLKLPAPYAISDADMESRGVFRTDPKAAGVSRYLRAEAQSKIDQLFNTTNL